ncbi:hypothetical protein FRC17_001135 [Serendipita sp. 399]|nr:hypothetical protein FRC17_001135 [Serendipita sp. 399]
MSEPATQDSQQPQQRRRNRIFIGTDHFPYIFPSTDVGANANAIAFKSDDFQAVLSRAKAAGVENQIITGGSLSESRTAIRVAKENGFYATIGCHPTRSSELTKQPPGQYINDLDKLISQNLTGPGRCVAVGECGLDYDRLFFSGKEDQKKAFRAQLTLAKKYHLPLFLHSRAAHLDFVALLVEAGMHENGGQAVGGRGGVAHSFTGTIEEMEELVAMGYYISVNGCSMKTTEQLDMVKRIPLDRLLLETDAPWCSLTGGHASKEHLTLLPSHLRKLYQPLSTQPDRWEEGKAVKGRNEPCAIGLVAFVVARLKGISLNEVAEHAWNNTIACFALNELEIGEGTSTATQSTAAQTTAS